MYPHVTQFESRRQDLERRLEGRREHRGARFAERIRNSDPAPELALRLRDDPLELDGRGGQGPRSVPLALRTLILSATMVVALTWLIMPRLTRVFRPWLGAGAR